MAHTISIDSLTNPDDVLDRYVAVASPNLGSGCWHRQDAYGDPFYCQHSAGTRADLAAMLLGRNWIACRAPADGLIDRISIDIDAQREPHDTRDRYDVLRKVFGTDRVPLVFRTPGGGLRVLYRIPRTPIERLITGPKTGLVADVLRAAGMAPGKGFIKIFPQAGLPDRLMLGARSPLLDPEALNPLPGCELGTEHDEVVLRNCLVRAEAWHGSPHEDLVSHLADAPQLGCVQLVVTKDDASEDSLFIRGADGRLSRSGLLARLVEGGLTAPKSRFDSEFLVAMAMALEPERFAAYGLKPLFTPPHLARAVGWWLADHHNGFSEEWNQSVARHASTEAAVTAWAERYMKPSQATGLNMVDRVMRAVRSADPLATRVRQVTDREWGALFRLGQRHFRGAALMKFETWTGAFYRAVKEAIHYHQANPPAEGETRRLEILTDGNGVDWVEVELAAEWQESWAYGGGGGKGKPMSYRVYRGVLEREELVLQRTAHRNYAAEYSDVPEGTPGLAASYLLLRPSEATLRDVAVAPWLLKEACAGIQISGRACELDHAYHALFAAENVRDLRKRYGYHAAKAIRERAATLRVNLQELVREKEPLQVAA